ncbi:xylulokinase [Egicoccus sp. AB-alg6-2]|uniref:xylulokinase n=1 Tax=Egicoccus sp. AB-alg6-2 TaxID=3242692 RepID=UPI00359F028D
MSDVTYLGLDLGTSSVKAVLTDGAGRLLGQAGAGYALASPQPGHADIDPEQWWTATVAAVSELSPSAAAPPRAIGLSGQMHGVVLTDPAGRATRPAVLWPDTRAVEHLERYAELPAAMRERQRNPLSPGMAGPILSWLQEHEPATLAAARWALQPKDWLRLRLTGDVAGDPSDASATLLYDVPGEQWDRELCRALGIDDGLLPPLAPSAAVGGALLPAAAAALGLPVGTPVAIGAADTAAAALGSGLRDPGQVQLTLGTGGQLVAPSSQARGRPESGTHLYRAATSAGWYAMAATLNAGLVLDWVRSSLAASWDELYAAAGVRPDDPYFVPHLAGERTPYLDPGLRAGWVGLGLDHDRQTMLRVTLEGVAHAVRDAFDALPDAHDVETIRIAGGGSRHPGFRQLLADVLERSLHAVDTPAASARGAALLAAVAVGDLTEDDVFGPLAPHVTPAAQPRPGTAELHRRRLGRFRELVARGATVAPQ